MSDAEFTSKRHAGNGGRERQSEIPLCGDGGSDLNRFFEALGDVRRRRILIYMRRNETVYLQDLATFIAEQEAIDPHSAEFKQIQIELVHLHLPKLADHGLLSFDDRTNLVSHESLPTAVEEILDLAAELDETDCSDRSNGYG